MWVSRREIARLERELRHALGRAKTAEDLLASERSSKDWMITQLTSRFVTKQGLYGLDHEPLKPITLTPHPKGFIREPNEIDEAKLTFYKNCAREAGLPEEDGERRWEAEMRGEMPTYEMESEQ